jgi:DNA modification methylase
MPIMAVNKLFYGDNLDVLREHVATTSVDLVYLDPPFNSNRGYNVIFAHHDTTSATDDRAQIQAFDDTWRWTPVTGDQFASYVGGGLPNEVANALTAFRTLLGENDAMAYLVNMAPRLVEMHRVLKSTGSLYLHCDPTMSHYLKVLLDAIFGAANFRNEIVWQRTAVKGDARVRLGRIHDVILCYGEPDATFRRTSTTHSEAYVLRFKFDDGDGRGPYSDAPLDSPNPRPNLTYDYKGNPPPANGWRVSREEMERLDADNRLIFPKKPGARIRRKNYLSEQEGVPLGDVWTDIPPLNSQAAERLGYPTQKPLALLDRIIGASSNEGDVVLDPFCGCGTTVDAAQRLGRHWLGIDVTYLAIDLIEKRLLHTYGESITGTYDVRGIPRDKAAALALFSRSPFDFERWAVSLVGGQPNQKQVGDKGIDGVARFPLDARGAVGRVLVSVKGGRQLNPSMVRDLGGTVATQKAEMGVLITNTPPTRGMTDEANHAGSYQHPHYEQSFPRIQIITVDELLTGKRPKMPPTLLPYIQAQRAKTVHDQSSLFDA